MSHEDEDLPLEACARLKIQENAKMKKEKN